MATADHGPGAGLPDSYKRWRSSRLGRMTDTLEERLVLDLLGPTEGLHVLDLGCGDGALAMTLALRGARVTGLDADLRMLAVARLRARAEAIELGLVHGLAETLPFPDGAFDCVVAVTVLCFVHAADPAIAEMARVLKPGGRLVVGELGRWSLWAAIRRVRGWLGAPTWKVARFRTDRELQSLLAAHDLTVRQRRGAIYYPPCGIAASLAAPLDPWLGQRKVVGAAFIGLSATKPGPNTKNGTR